MFNFNFDPVRFVAIVIAFIVGISVHEFSHALSAYKLGDPTAKQAGRLSLNPLVHFDPLGFLMMLMLSLGIPALAWGKPVPVNPNRLQGGRRGMAVTALAGPASNLVTATVAAGVLRLMDSQGMVAYNPGTLVTVVSYVIYLNVLLAVFNLIPIPPLDGFNILMGLVSDFWVQFLAPLQRYGMFILLALVFLGGGVLFTYIIDPVASLFLNALIG
ncbi:MAG: site-2 protease family protein [Chloroflexi bacterium]|nr:site-2 protease family protein [Chloroflexota bacterium]